MFRILWLLYRIWHLYESNNEFVSQVKVSKTFYTVVNTASYTHLISECRVTNTSMPYLLRLSELTLHPDAAALYKKIWDTTHCLQDPSILTRKMMELTDIHNQLIEESKTGELVVYNPYAIKKIEIPKQEVKEENGVFSILKGAAYELGQESMNYFFRKPSHTPIYDKLTTVQNKMKTYYRTYYQIQFLAIDVSDELMLFQKKFQQVVHTSFGIYTSSGILIADITGYMYGGDNAVLIIEGIGQML
jgi:hypothetical protein